MRERAKVAVAAILLALLSRAEPAAGQASFISAKAARAKAGAIEAELAAISGGFTERMADRAIELVAMSKREGSLPYLAAAIAAKAAAGTASLPELLLLVAAGAYAPIDMDIARGALAIAAREAGLEGAASAYLVRLLNESYGPSIGYRAPTLAERGIGTVAAFIARWAEVELLLADGEDARRWIGTLVEAGEYDWALRTLALARGRGLVELSYERVMRSGIQRLAAAEAEALARAEAQALASRPGSIYVTTEPQCKVCLDDEVDARKTPFLFEGIPPGEHTISVQPMLVRRRYLIGGPYSILVAPGERAIVNGSLGKGTASLRIEGIPSGAALSIEGMDYPLVEAGDGGLFFEGSVPAGIVDIEVRARDKSWVRRDLSCPIGPATSIALRNQDLTVYPRRATMKIDGKIDDWRGIDSAIEDPVGDAAKLFGAGTDIARAYLATDAKNLYWRIDFADGSPSASEEWRKWAFKIRVPGVSEIERSLALCVEGPQKNGRFSATVNLFDYPPEVGSTDLSSRKTGKYSFGEACIEASFPLADFGEALVDSKKYPASFSVRAGPSDEASDDSGGFLISILEP